ncbi:Glu-tRNA(Gln) amidotransferase GatDE subunit D [Candidatus Pacearchaeota archaeon CG_4_9_14_3_um_filter_31_7]|nr:MAG: Glu-tRNA(Gln) amidotransferase GatDE subunit D [Candidatus Pacearchaeota archaeon CG10_big_fil_rev_8_21_14_0_10_31_59]PIZ80264.1 MAG: Glu-tRNA(Gln) amidotransferase GatDE subunit D [Candidatus Pacearchaeota archaeon CG_4_10_14_0_2_um_filter_31_10]PJA70887.1 MAG: Glu-tRNA(Gln) amidotransferase GatDE subunit D [Candidatus Pacearchaeota archaeon CG_4_9_14_3_um_filter_31_7]
MPKKESDSTEIYEFKLKDGSVEEGIILESHDKNVVLIKRSDGYNIGIKKEDIKEKKVVGHQQNIGSTSVVKTETKKNLGRIGVILTGGTISSKVDYKTGAVTPIKNPSELIENIPGLNEIVEIKKISIPFNIDSSNITAEHWKILAKEIYEMLKDKEIQGVVVAHGTDTLHYTSAMISFMLEVNKPVIFTYSQRSVDRASSDAFFNFKSACIMALTDVAEVLVVGHEKTDDENCFAIYGTKVRKLHSTRRDAFRPINDLPVTLINKDLKLKFLKDDYNKKSGKEPKLNDKIEEKILLLKYTPNLNPKILDFVSKNYKGVVVESLGLGQINIGGKYSFLEKLKELTKKIPVCFTTQCVYGEVNSNVYSVARELEKAGVIYLKDMLSEVAYVKLMHVLANVNEKEKIKQYMLHNYQHEFNDRLQEKTFLY